MGSTFRALTRSPVTFAHSRGLGGGTGPKSVTRSRVASPGQSSRPQVSPRASPALGRQQAGHAGSAAALDSGGISRPC